MEKTVINGEINVLVPDGFAVMDREELARVYKKDNDRFWGMKKTGSPEEGIYVIVDWEDYNPLVLMLLSAKDIARRNEQIHAGVYADYGYRKGTVFERTVCGRKAAGYRFSYSVKGKDLRASSILFKHGSRVYKFTCAADTADETAGPVFESFLDSAAF